jgi:outer membrane PBP1 activator LpoA protein
MASKIWSDVSANESVVDEPHVDSVTDLAEICGWLGTYRERLRKARDEDRQQVTNGVTRWTVRYQQRRSELA